MDGKPPARIWLQWADEGDYESYDDLEGVTWAANSINETDVEYVPAARIAELETVAKRLLDTDIMYGVICPLCEGPMGIEDYEHGRLCPIALARQTLSGAEEDA